DGFGSKAEGRERSGWTSNYSLSRSMCCSSVNRGTDQFLHEYMLLTMANSSHTVHEPETKSVLDSSSPAAANANQTHPEKTEGKEGGKEHGQRPATAEGESKSRKKPQFQGRGRGIGIMNKGRGGWTGAGFDVDGRT
ncbi:unnamed protein product, partial [Brassica rapa subsp. trilocularis]